MSESAQVWNVPEAETQRAFAENDIQSDENGLIII